MKTAIGLCAILLIIELVEIHNIAVLFIHFICYQCRKFHTLELKVMRCLKTYEIVLFTCSAEGYYY